jgi:uncharacterized protein
MEVEISGEVFVLYAQKAMFWKRNRILFIADLHLGKISHFRRAGIAVPHRANEHNIELLVELIQSTHPAKIICLGDLFHSHYNEEWEVFGEVVRHFSHIPFELVLGNHDIMSDHQYERKGITVHDELVLHPFIFTHHPLESIPELLYNISGHIHPGINLRGKGRQSITLPCFFFGQTQGFLPAFGSFTGLALIHPKKNDKIFVIAENKIMFVN